MLKIYGENIMNLINEICTVVLLIIVIHIILVWIENIIDKNKKNDATEYINKVKNILVVVLGIFILSSLIDIYNILMKDTGSYFFNTLLNINLAINT